MEKLCANITGMGNRELVRYPYNSPSGTTSCWHLHTLIKNTKRSNNEAAMTLFQGPAGGWSIIHAGRCRFSTEQIKRLPGEKTK